ncbi:MAG TPA: hypothetical protein VFK16_05750 [Gemmatimonadaceae bacterium]|jgi:hypothetical protein|nr:hypothetical protein [Gemmatimonadaceae bacterium]
MFTLINVVLGLVGSVVLGVLFLIGLPFILMIVLALVAFAVLAMVFGLVVGLLKLALFVVLPVLVVFWVVKAVFGIGRRPRHLV